MPREPYSLSLLLLFLSLMLPSLSRCAATPLLAYYLASPTRAGLDPAISDASSPNPAVKSLSPSLAHAPRHTLLRPRLAPCLCFMRASTHAVCFELEVAVNPIAGPPSPSPRTPSPPVAGLCFPGEGISFVDRESL